MGKVCNGCKYFNVCGDPSRKQDCGGYSAKNPNKVRPTEKVKPVKVCKGCKHFNECGDPQRTHKCEGYAKKPSRRK